jgi:CRP/FNR family transcriptional regulator
MDALTPHAARSAHTPAATHIALHAAQVPPCVRLIGSPDSGKLGDRHCDGHCPAPWGGCAARDLASHDTLFNGGDRETLIYRVISGVVALFKILANGRRQITGFALPGDFIGLDFASHRPCHAEAVTPVRLRCVAKEAVHKAARENPAIAYKLYEAVAADLGAAQDLALTLGQRTAPESVAAFLLLLSRRNARRGEDALRIDLPMRRTDIADHLGLTIETVSRTLTRFKRRGLIGLSGFRHVEIRNMAGLRALAEDGAE